MRARPMLTAFLLAATLAACGGGPGKPGVEVAPCVSSCAGKVCGDDGCGGACGACPAASICVSGACVASCTPSCAGKVCGDDGCGGSCGTCPPGAACVQGACEAPRNSPGCPEGGTCNYLQRTAWRYDCTSADQCQRAGAIGTYGTYEACQTCGCMGGNSRCGDQFGNPSDPERWSCEQCRVSCHDGVLAACGVEHETGQGCLLPDSICGTYLAVCICQ